MSFECEFYCDGKRCNEKALAEIILNYLNVSPSEFNGDYVVYESEQLVIEISENERWLDNDSPGFMRYRYVILISSDLKQNDYIAFINDLYKLLDEQFKVFTSWEFEENYPELSMDKN